MAFTQCIILLTITFFLCAESFIPRRCEMDLPRSCVCHFPSRPFVSCRGRLTSYPDFPKINLLRIHTLDLSHNRLYGISTDVCQYCTGIKRLDLSHNLISQIGKYAFFKSLWSYDLEYLDLSYNKISTAYPLSGLANLSRMKTLKLDHNEMILISHDTFPNLASVTTVTLHGNRLFGLTLKGISPKTISFSLFINVRGVDLPSNIEKFLFYGGGLFEEKLNIETSNFKSVALEHCGLNTSNILESGFFDNVPKLKHLNLKGNRLSPKDQQGFRNVMNKVKHIEYLDLSDNRITDITADTFAPVNKLKYLNLSSNVISKIDWQFLASLPDLEVLDLSNNGISNSTGMKEPILALAKLNSLKIGNNPFNCSCEGVKEIHGIMVISLVEFPHVMDQNQIMSSLNCGGPQQFSNTSIFDFYFDECSSLDVII